MKPKLDLGIPLTAHSFRETPKKIVPAGCIYKAPTCTKVLSKSSVSSLFLFVRILNLISETPKT